MKALKFVFAPLILLVLVNFGNAQCALEGGVCLSQVPHLIKFSGSLTGMVGTLRPGPVEITFAMYSEAKGGTPLWQETQTVQLDRQGRYSTLLGATTLGGVPTHLFLTGEPRWMEARAQLAGDVEPARVLLVSVPYALVAGDAQTLGGLPPSAFVKMGPDGAVQNVSGSGVGPAERLSPTAITAGTAAGPLTSEVVTTPGGTPNVIPRFSDGTSLVNSQITDSSGVVRMQNLSNVLFADRFPKGVPDAVAACPAAGCVIYALSPDVPRDLGTIDPGSKVITLHLGPFTYTVNQITVRSGMKIIGMGSSPNGTVLQSVNGNKPVIVLPQVNNLAASNVVLSGFRLIGSVGNTDEDAFFFDTTSLTNAGLWYATISDISILNFAGIGVHVKGPNNFGALVQWVTFDRIAIARPQGSGNGIRIEGGAFELLFTDCHIDGYAPGGQAQPESGTNVYIGGMPGGVNGYPLDISFQGLVSQAAATAVQLDGASGISFYHSHHEIVLGGYLITDSTNIGTYGVTISDSTFMGNVGINAGLGYLLNIATPSARGIRFVHNLFGAADSIVTGTNLSQIVYRDNLYLGSSTVPPTTGITAQLVPNTSINIGGAHSVGLSQSTTPISTIQSTLGPGEMVTLFALGGTVRFASGGNINLMGKAGATVNGSITFIRNDGTGALSWTPVAQWNPVPSSHSIPPVLRHPILPRPIPNPHGVTRRPS